MPRINSLDPARRSVHRLCVFIKDRMEIQNINQAKLAEELGTSQQNVSRKLKAERFSLVELVKILYLIKATQEEIGELLSYED